MVERSDTTGSWSPKDPMHPGRDASTVACIAPAFGMAGGDGVDEIRWVAAWVGAVRIVGILGRLRVLASWRDRFLLGLAPLPGCVS